MPRAEPALPLHHALLLGLLQGPTELLPVSSTAHTILVPALAGWPYGELDPATRKSFELALHGGGALALALAARDLLQRTAHGKGAARELAVLALSGAPPGCAGVLAKGAVERRLSRPAPVAATLVVGALAMTLADRGPQRRCRAQAGAADGLTLGIAQALALVPGVSRNGATIAAARLRGFRRPDAAELSWQTGLPVMLGAALVRLALFTRARTQPLPGAAPALAVGAGAAFCSTLAAARLLGPRRGRRLAPYAAYRCLLAALVFARCAHNRCR